MSNIGFMRNATKHNEELWNKYMSNPKKSPTKQEKEHYLFLLEQFQTMHKFNEIEDKQLYEVLLRKFKNNDLTQLVDYRKKLRKTELKKKVG